MLDAILEATRQRVNAEKAEVSLSQVINAAEKAECSRLCFEKSLKGGDISFICELKKASPSKGLISPDFPYLQIAEEYEEAGASAISVLTEPSYFLGSNSYLKEVKKKVSIPVLRKDFVIDEYQIYQARALGADAVLLITSVCQDNLSSMIHLCDNLGMSALVETHSAEEIHLALDAGARVIGINNRDLKTFKTDISHCISLRNLIPSDCVFVAESGIHTRTDIETLIKLNTDAVLIGEALMTSPNRKAVLKSLQGEIFD